MLNSWLTTQIRIDATLPFQVLDVRERPVDRKQVVDVLANELRIANKDPVQLRHIATSLGLKYLRDYLANNTFATTRNVRIGDFGEILGAALLREREGLHIPIFKLRYREKRDWPMRLTDIVAIEMNHEKQIVGVCFSEVKTRTSRDLQAAVKGHDSLSKECTTEVPEILNFVINRLSDLQRYAEADALMDFLQVGYDSAAKNYQVTLLFDSSSWREDVLIRLKDLPPRLSNLRVEVILVDGLAALIDDCYTAAVGVSDGDC